MSCDEGVPSIARGFGFVLELFPCWDREALLSVAIPWLRTGIRVDELLFTELLFAGGFVGTTARTFPGFGAFSVRPLSPLEPRFGKIALREEEFKGFCVLPVWVAAGARPGLPLAAEGTERGMAGEPVVGPRFPVGLRC